MAKYSVTFDQALRDLRECFSKWDIDDWDIERGYGGARKGTPKVTVWWVEKTGKRIELSCEAEASQRENLRALGLCIDDLRMQEVRGVASLMASAYAQIAAPAAVRDPFEILGVRPDANPAVIAASFKALAKTAHPDKGGSVEAFNELQGAFDALKEKGVVPNA